MQIGGSLDGLDKSLKSRHRFYRSSLADVVRKLIELADDSVDHYAH